MDYLKAGLPAQAQPHQQQQYLRPPPFHVRSRRASPVDPDTSTPVTRHLATNHARKSSQAVDPFVTPFDDEHAARLAVTADQHGRAAARAGGLVRALRLALRVREFERLHDPLARHERLRRLLRHRGRLCGGARRGGGTLGRAAPDRGVVAVEGVGDAGLVERLELALALFLEEQLRGRT